MYLTSFIHRQDLFQIAERWFCGRPEPNDALRLTEILIADGFVVAETIGSISRLLLETVCQGAIQEERIHFKGELRERIFSCRATATPRVGELFREYEANPDFYYREAPINAVVYLDEWGCFLGLSRIKRPKRIAEKANRKIANWIFQIVQDTARNMAERRAEKYGIPLHCLLTPEKEMIREFIEAEKTVARSFRDGTIKFDRAALSINDIGGMKIVADETRLAHLEKILAGDPALKVVDRENYQGDYRARSMLLEVAWDPERVCRRYADGRCWEKFLNRGIPEDKLKKGLEPLLDRAEPKIIVELILSTYPDMVESEFGSSIHEERILAQRYNKDYKGYVPTNVEFLLEYLFAVGFSPQIHISEIPIKLWGRYLPDTLISHIRSLYHLPEYDLLY
ncbi:MAG: hypothetical protein LLF99_08655 [Desulfobacteraceae bacterium]|nr:hypothetical protein [Desulfobacteraceae bacterium]